MRMALKANKWTGGKIERQSAYIDASINGVTCGILNRGCNRLSGINNNDLCLHLRIVLRNIR